MLDNKVHGEYRGGTKLILETTRTRPGENRGASRNVRHTALDSIGSRSGEEGSVESKTDRHQRGVGEREREGAVLR